MNAKPTCAERRARRRRAAPGRARAGPSAARRTRRRRRRRRRGRPSGSATRHAARSGRRAPGGGAPSRRCRSLHRAPAPPAGRRAVVEARAARVRGADPDAGALGRVPSICAASSATMPSARRGESAAARSPSTGTPSASERERRARAGELRASRRCALTRRRAAGAPLDERRDDAGVDRLAQVARLGEHVGGDGARRLGHEPGAGPASARGRPA